MVSEIKREWINKWRDEMSLFHKIYFIIFLICLIGIIIANIITWGNLNEIQENLRGMR